MGRIHVLPDSLVNRIAAGEVVERPASVVKELIENSLDAGAGSVEIRLDGGGKRLVRVADDGTGMDRDDALLALERHATSKLHGPQDLEAIETLGFRGEALASIAAVSSLVLQTSTGSGIGTEIEVRGGRIRSVKETGAPRGTVVEVERLFFNVPARRKFLRADATELSHAAKLTTRCALAHPGVRFRLEHGARRLLDADPAAGLDERIAQVYGRATAEKLLPFDRIAAGVRVYGYAGRPAASLPRRDGQHFFVNGRIVQDRLLGHAILAAYGNTMPKGRFPMLFLFLEIDPARVDVNVHPRKNEVRFHRGGAVHDAVRDAVAGALSHEAVVPALSDLRPASRPVESEGIARAAGSYLELAERRATEREVGRGAAVYRPREEGDEPTRSSQGGRPDERERDESPSGIKPLAQFRDSYIVAEDRDGLVLVDQHAAHERVLFERYREDAEKNRVEVQRLLFPVTVELAPHEYLVVEEEADELRRLGFDVEPFGGRSVRVDGVPAVAGEVQAESLLRELLGEAARARSAAADVRQLCLRLVTTAACKAAVKKNDPLNRESMQQLLDDLFATANPSTCPHGRPLVFRLTLDEIERAFGRR